MDDTAIPPLPSAPSVTISGGITIQPPLSRKGVGLGLIVLVYSNTELSNGEGTTDPPPLKKWAEEGYAVAQVPINTGYEDKVQILNAREGLRTICECDPRSRLGLISYGPDLIATLQHLDEEVMDEIKAVVSYDTQAIFSWDFKTPLLLHRGTKTSDSFDAVTSNKVAKQFEYPNAGPHFVLPSHANYHHSAAALSHTRTLTFLKPLLHGPYFDLEAIWEEHTAFEFGERSVEKTMATMVDEPYVNHIPTMTGGIGRKKLTEFYRNHFIFSNPDDTQLELVSRTVGIDRVVDEFVLVCTHDRKIDWLLPSVPPTNKPLRVPMTSIVNIRGDRLCHEHISWGQPTVLVQLGLLPRYLPFRYSINGYTASADARYEIQTPAAGQEIAEKLVDEGAVESNQLMGIGNWEVADTAVLRYSTRT